jgi:S-adenosylmethionine synthetase
MKLIVRPNGRAASGSSPVEVVERKGLGHPDTICDAIAEHISVALCLHYLDRFGMILHHNVDKVLLCGGAARATFGGGEVLEPIEIYLAGRATQEHGGRRIPVPDIAIEACRNWLARHLRNLDVDRHVRIVSRLRAGSTDLTDLFARKSAIPLANDTSCGVGFAPLTDLEKAVLAVERALNDPETKKAHPEIGEDIKVMGVRHHGRIQLTVGCAFVGRYVADLEDYTRKKTTVRELATQAARSETALEVDASINVGDDLDRGNVFLTVTGTSAEAGDDGEVGRGNRVNGLITPYRAMTLEAAAGKNPVSHVGKLYNLVASRIAATLTQELPGIANAECILVSQIGRPVDDPQLVDIALSAEASSRVSHPAISNVVRAELAQLPARRDELLAERLTVY